MPSAWLAHQGISALHFAFYEIFLLELKLEANCYQHLSFSCISLCIQISSVLRCVPILHTKNMIVQRVNVLFCGHQLYFPVSINLWVFTCLHDIWQMCLIMSENCCSLYYWSEYFHSALADPWHMKFHTAKSKFLPEFNIYFRHNCFIGGCHNNQHSTKTTWAWELAQVYLAVDMVPKPETGSQELLWIIVHIIGPCQECCVHCWAPYSCKYTKLQNANTWLDNWLVLHFKHIGELWNTFALDSTLGAGCSTSQEL